MNRTIIMHSTRLPTERVSGVSTSWRGVGPQVNKFEQVPSDDH